MTKYIKFVFENTEPLKIADDSSSQSGQVHALSYIPGSALRGAVINAFVKTGEFNSLKSFLLSDKVAFLNAYIMKNGQELIPTLKGFYEDKTDEADNGKQIENMLMDDDITPGNKRASVGKYCYMEESQGDKILRYTGVKMGSDMKINKGKQGSERTVFRNQYILPGNCFSTAIAVFDDEDKAEKLENILEVIQENDDLVLGGSRSFGYGKCTIRKIELTERMPYKKYAPQEDLKDQAYMVLLSDMTMANDSGQIVGIDCDCLKRELNLEELKIENCATSVTDVRGYNRTWKTWTPAVNMYEMGSVFKLEFPGQTISKSVLDKIMNEGIGVRTNEGFGRVLFLENYDRLRMKKEITPAAVEKSNDDSTLSEEEKNTLHIAAKGYYQNLINKGINNYLADERNSISKYKLNGSQLGTIESILYANLYSANDGWEELEKYFANVKKKEGKKRTQKDFTHQSGIINYINMLRGADLKELFELPKDAMGISFNDIFSREDIDKIKQELIISLIKRANREGVN